VEEEKESFEAMFAVYHKHLSCAQSFVELHFIPSDTDFLLSENHQYKNLG
jgi:hypothetical protein